jgi:hypothetical protein
VVTALCHLRALVGADQRGQVSGGFPDEGEWAAMNVTIWLPALHMGALHPYEKVLTVVLAFGPFLLLGAVIAVRRRHDALEDAASDETQRDK